jgi:MFS family permease
MTGAPTAPPARHAFGVYLGALQLFFTLCWTAYVIYLPKLAAQAGIDRTWVPWILVLDQVIFSVCDWSMGVAADRVAKVAGRLSRWVALTTAVSCLAFLLLPFVTPAGVAWPFMALTVLWTATSSALRAPPLVLLGKYVPKPDQPWLASLMLFGLGVAGALSPYLTVALRETDPRCPSPSPRSRW